MNTEILSFVFQVKEHGFFIQTVAYSSVVFSIYPHKMEPKRRHS